MRGLSMHAVSGHCPPMSGGKVAPVFPHTMRSDGKIAKKDLFRAQAVLEYGVIRVVCAKEPDGSASARTNDAKKSFFMETTYYNIFFICHTYTGEI